MIIPNNITTTNYASEGYYRIKSTNTPYKGYYYELNGKLYTGKEYSSSSVEIIHYTKVDPALNNISTATYAIRSKVGINDLQKPEIITTMPNPSAIVRYYYRQVNVQPINIKEIDKDSYDRIQNKPLYQSTFVGNGQTVDQAEAQLPGIKTFLKG